MSVTIDLRVVDPGAETYIDDAWRLKEQIHRNENVLKQRRGFFTDAYRRSTVYALVQSGETDRLVGFAATRRDGYILFLAVDPEHRGEGLGGQLVAAVAEDHDSVTCHARATNEAAIEFYKHLGFNVERHIEGYYEDNGDAYYLRLGDAGLATRLSRLVRGG
ncbi:MAG: N-acetyltransferase [Natronomonas sp.]